MPRRGWRKRPEVVGDLTDPLGLPAAVLRYLEWLRVHAYSEYTVVDRRERLNLFLRWCEERAALRPGDVTRALLERYQRWLYYYRKPDGTPLTQLSHYSRLVPVRTFFAWLTRERVLLYNPASELTLPRLGQRLPRAVLTAAEADQVMAQPDVTVPLGLRDRAILETLYSTGMRRLELIHLGHEDLDLGRATVTIREGKGKKDRVVPIGERALAWIERYLGEVRPRLLPAAGERALFLLHDGTPMTRHQLTRLVRQYVEAAQVGKHGSCHLLRHTMATLMLENGADIRYIQQMLGHAKVSTTQIYTRVSITKLKAVHTATHPGAKLGRSAHAED